MSLHIYDSDRIEDSTAHLKGKLAEERRKSAPFAFLNTSATLCYIAVRRRSVP